MNTVVICNNKIDSLFDSKIDSVTRGLRHDANRYLRTISIQNALVIIDYITSMRTEINLSDNYRRDLIILLCRFSRINHHKPFEQITRQDVISFLDSFRKAEDIDSLHKWIGTYNLYRTHVLRFFMFSRKMTDSIARNNDVSNEDRGIVISESSNNEIYNNTVLDSGSGIEVDEDSSGNSIHDNTIVDIEAPEDALGIEDGAESENTLFSNEIIDSKTGSNITLDQNPTLPSPSPDDSGDGNNGDNEGGGEESGDGGEGGNDDEGEDNSGGSDDEESEE